MSKGVVELRENGSCSGSGGEVIKIILKEWKPYLRLEMLGGGCDFF